MEIIKILSIAVIVLISVFELATFMVYGGFINKQTQEFFCNLKEDDYRVSEMDCSILTLKKGSYITNVPFSVFSKYHIQGFGTVPRWSKLHKKINEYYLTVLTK